jgi:Zn-dependent protease
MDDPKPRDHRSILSLMHGNWGGRRPVSQDPMSWSIHVANIRSVALRVHVLFLLFILVELSRAVIVGREATSYMPLGFTWTAFSLVSLLILVLGHEASHVMVSKRLRARPAEVLIWPLGGLAIAPSPVGWLGQLLVAAGGPAFNAIIFLVLAPVLYFETGSLNVAIPSILGADGLSEGLFFTAGSWVLTSIFVAQWVNTLLLVLNLLPLFPLDGGRILHAVLWRFFGYERAMVYSTWVAISASAILAAVGLLFASGAYAGYLVGLAFFCGAVSLNAARKMRFTHDELEALEPSERFERSEHPDSSEVIGRLGPAVESPETRDRAVEDRIERILEKISEHGIKSLGFRERRLLRRSSKKRRRDSSS